MSNTQPLVEFLRGEPVITLFLSLGAGYLLGRIRVFGFSFGAVAGTLLVSLVLGRYGFRMSPGAQAVGFDLGDRVHGIVEHRKGMASEQVGGRRRCSAIGQVHEIEPGGIGK